MKNREKSPKIDAKHQNDLFPTPRQRLWRPRRDFGGQNDPALFTMRTFRIEQRNAQGPQQSQNTTSTAWSTEQSHTPAILKDAADSIAPRIPPNQLSHENLSQQGLFWPKAPRICPKGTPKFQKPFPKPSKSSQNPPKIDPSRLLEPILDQCCQIY